MPFEENAYGQYEIQKTLLDMIAEIDRVCRKHDIWYSLLGGTMLGAARHKGFIPWDDDLDLVFTADSLKRFMEIFPQESQRYTVTDQDTWVARVVPRQPINGQRPFADLFHFEPISASPLQRRVKGLLLQTLQGMLKERVDLSRFGLKERILLGGTHALGLLFTRRAKLRMYRWISAHVARGDGSLLHISDDQFHLLSLTYRGACAGGLIDTPFETATLQMSALYDEMLRQQYGDYMTPPPESQRKPLHEDWRSL